MKAHFLLSLFDVRSRFQSSENPAVDDKIKDVLSDDLKRSRGANEKAATCAMTACPDCSDKEVNAPSSSKRIYFGNN
ncbi:hypothetical protein [Herbaspirillum sp. CF444]|uniref:hypothetical protein n=1 Tax=Herbaspirillum sp. CF444 TaxID=1144319 RepID=UPI0012F7A3A2|nr:hypothetical protein [Herbaspirillum sp. CF444]